MDYGLHPVRILPAINKQDGWMEPKNNKSGLDNIAKENTYLKKMTTGKVILCSHTHTRGP